MGNGIGEEWDQQSSTYPRIDKRVSRGQREVFDAAENVVTDTRSLS
jgi:hypothetical protein